MTADDLGDTSPREVEMLWWLLLAGKLADGFRGVPYGPAEVLTISPGEGCQENPSQGTRWTCPVKLGDASVTAHYLAEEGLFYSVFLESTDGHALHDVLSAAYGTCRPLHDYDTAALADCAWSDGNAVAIWEYNQFSGKAQVLLFDRVLQAQVKAAAGRRAAEAAKGL